MIRHIRLLAPVLAITIAISAATYVVWPLPRALLGPETAPDATVDPTVLARLPVNRIKVHGVGLGDNISLIPVKDLVGTKDLAKLTAGTDDRVLMTAEAVITANRDGTIRAICVWHAPYEALQINTLQDVEHIFGKAETVKTLKAAKNSSEPDVTIFSYDHGQRTVSWSSDVDYNRSVMLTAPPATDLSGR